jgi:hypothetical protein
MFATCRRRVNVNSIRDDTAPGARLQDIREVESRIQRKGVSGSVLCIAVLKGCDAAIMSLWANLL